jgi:3-deoxy-manno-octulosonate cytidylyltransferase (CMP-KDO synthetase)
MPEAPVKVVAIIPARYASTRFPGKPLIKIDGISMIERVYKQTEKARLVQEVLVATDDQRIAAAVSEFGGKVIMTRDDHPSGTDRLAEVAQANPDYEVIVNVQGDEPIIDPDSIDAAVEPLISDPAIEMSTLSRPVSAEDALSPQLVKVVTDRLGFALYFSRAPIPFHRAEGAEQHYLGHTGLYVYRRSCLLKIAAWEPTPLEQAEFLEQLRALENGIKIKVVQFNTQALAVDVPEDVARIEAALKNAMSTQKR